MAAPVQILNDEFIDKLFTRFHNMRPTTWYDTMRIGLFVFVE